MTVPNPPGAGSYVGPPGKTRLITKPVGDPHVDGGVQEADVRLALTRGLAEYMEQLSYAPLGGRPLRFKAVHEEWAEPEENAAYPAASITLAGAGTYEPRSLTPVLNPKQRLPPPDGRYLVIPAEYSASISVEVWATDPEERSGLIQMLEIAFNPVHWRYGFVLELPHYFNVRATYTLQEMSIPDDSEDALRRYRRVVFTLRAQAPLITLFSFPDARPMFELAALGADVDVTPDSAVLVIPEIS